MRSKKIFVIQKTEKVQPNLPIKIALIILWEQKHESKQKLIQKLYVAFFLL